MNSKVPRATRFGRLAWRLASALGVGTALAASPAAAQSVSPEQAPAEWVRYADYATKTITTWLEAQSEAAIRLRTYLDATRAAPDQPTAPLMLKIWIGKDGKVARIEHTPFAHAEANADLRALIVGGELDVSPPEDMLLPLRILVQLPPAPAQATSQTALETANRKLQPPAPDQRPATAALGLPERGGVNRLQLEGQPGAKPPTIH
ncbi:hypothetical protein PX699_15530 [Sphingobium sp. H39-3-25]|uniref:hypothetical protein n=1 Tax=Sphingobium arseniciresistens TaxID=3030834 RepID=UPI0023B9DCAD|nr:hypothetical protein [Sphingobium arseniciresistens]